MAGNKIYVQGNYVDVHDNEVVNLSIDKAGTVNVSKRQEERVQTDVPEVLAKSELWERLKQAGLIDDDGQPTVSRPEAALMANMLAYRLNITNKWKMFEARRCGTVTICAVTTILLWNKRSHWNFRID